MAPNRRSSPVLVVSTGDGFSYGAMPPKRQPSLDRIDIKSLAVLQRNGRSTIQKLAETVGLSPRPCLERVRRLETAGIIVGYQAVLQLERLGRPVSIFAEVALEKQ